MNVFDENPIFDEEYNTINMDCISYIEDEKTVTEVFCLNAEGLPCKRRYINGKFADEDTWESLEDMKSNKDKEYQLFYSFYHWVKKNKGRAALINIAAGNRI